MEIINDLSENQIQQLHQLYQNEWWTENRTLEETRECVLGSQICIAIVDDNQVIKAFARVLTDYIFKALIFDMIVKSDYRVSGLGSELIKLIKGHAELKSVKHFELYCLPELEPFYTKHGFSIDVGGIKLMRLKNA
jgi:predicted GNAT family N-acyltransferase